MTTISLRELPGALKKTMKGVATASRRGLRRAARTGRGTIKKNVPVAFGELRESVHAADTEDGARIITDAPHAAAVENGSRPHWVPLDALVKWVKLRAMQSLKLVDATMRANKANASSMRASNRLASASKAWDKASAKGKDRYHLMDISARMDRARTSKAKYDAKVSRAASAGDRLPGATSGGHASRIGSWMRSMGGSSTSVDAPTEIARMIQRAIAARGTRPHAYTRKSLPSIEGDAIRFITEELSKVK